MGAVFFYHLTRNPLERTLPVLIEKALQAGWSVEVRGTQSDGLKDLDQSLWKTPEDGFLPHALANTPEAEHSPVVLSLTPVIPPRNCIMSVHSATITPEEINTAARVCVLFDGHDEAALHHARQQWKSLTDAGCAAQYWSEADGTWQKKAEANAP